MEYINQINGKLKEWGVETKDLLIAFSISPLLAILIIDFNSFTWGWNEGRGGLLFAILFLLIEWVDGRKRIKLKFGKKRILGLICSVAILSAYFIAIYKFNLQEILFNYGRDFAVEGGLPSWVWLWDWSLWRYFA